MHLKAEMCDKPVGKVMGWGTCQDHVEFGDSHLIPTDMWMWSCVDVFSLLEYKPLPNKSSLFSFLEDKTSIIPENPDMENE